MYCPSCGAELVEGFRYCKRCGTNVTGAESIPAGKKFSVGLTIAFLVVVAGIFSVGVALPLAASHDMIRDGFLPRDIMMLSFADLLATLLVIGLLVWSYLRIAGVRLGNPSPAVQKVAQLEAERLQVGPPLESLGSVTENTTRTLEGRRLDKQRSL
jgi:hypothetical protein